jgi:hypothetical protein
MVSLVGARGDKPLPLEIALTGVERWTDGAIT